MENNGLSQEGGELHVVGYCTYVGLCQRINKNFKQCWSPRSPKWHVENFSILLSSTTPVQCEKDLSNSANTDDWSWSIAWVWHVLFHTLFPMFWLWVWDLAGGSMVRCFIGKLEDHSEIPRNPQRNKLHKQVQDLIDRLCLIEKDGRTVEGYSWHRSLDLMGTCTGIQYTHANMHPYERAWKRETQNFANIVRVQSVFSYIYGSPLCLLPPPFTLRAIWFMLITYH